MDSKEGSPFIENGVRQHVSSGSMIGWKKILPGILLILIGLYFLGLTIAGAWTYSLILASGSVLLFCGLGGRSLVSLRKA